MCPWSYADMVASLVHTAPTPADWAALDPKTPALALVGPMPPAAGKEALFAVSLPHVAIDGGIAHAPAPVLWAGDGDSGARPAHIPAFIKPTQDETDLRFCLSGIDAWQWTQLHLYGFLGGRRDHELANFGEIHAAMRTRAACATACFYDAHGAPSVLFFNTGRHEVQIKSRFSLFSLSPAIVSLSGACAYPARDLHLPPLSGHGISNGGQGMVEITADAPVLIVL